MGMAARQVDWTSVPDRMVDHALRQPDAIAVETAGERLTYRQLAMRVDALAARLAERLSPDNRLVGVCLDRTVDLSAWLLAILKAGAAYLPIDPSLPAARITQVIDSAGPAIIVASRGLQSVLPPTAVPVLIAEDEVAAPPPPSLSRPLAGPDALAYVIYTSGSTGMPKGVEITQGALVAMLEAIADVPGFVTGESLMALTRISFDLSVVDMFMPFFAGGRLILIDLDEAGDPRRLAAAFDRHRPDVVQATPSTWRALLEAGWQGARPLRLMCGGEAMTRDLATRLLACCSQLWNMYGPTETTVWSTAHRVVAGEGPVPIGAPIPGTTIRIADAALAPVAAGDVGEIAIGGPSVARGYRAAPDLTAERFVVLEDGTRAYRTGDLGRIGDDGLIHCLGRLDDQVKIRGFRIELGDVEAALSAHPEVSWCAARAWTDKAGDTLLVGYVVARHGGTLASGDLRGFLAARLPSYMVPSRFVPMAQMPLTPNGKVDRAALPDPVAPVVAPRPDEKPVLAIEQRLADIWSELLNVPAVGRQDDFFDLGGYSLITVRLLRRIEQEFGRVLEIAQLMQGSTLAAMAALIADRTVAANPLTLLNHAGPRPPLFWLDAGPLIRGVARDMTAEQPVMSLNLTRLEEEMLNGDAVDLTAVASVLRGRLREAQPQGPYYVAGWCRWGVVAFELARQLRETQQEVALVVMLDSTAGGRGALRRLSPRGMVRWIKRLLRGAPQLPVGEETRSFSQRIERASKRYRPQRIDADVLLVRPVDAVRGAADGGWRRFVPRGRLRIERSPGDHVTMVRSSLGAELAQVIERCLRATQQQREGAIGAPAAMISGGLTEDVHAAVAAPV